MNKKIAIVAFIVIIIVAVTAYIKICSMPIESAKNFLNAVNENNINKVESFLSKDFKKKFTKEQIADYLVLNDFLNHKKVKLSLVDDPKIKNSNLKVVRGSITNSDNSVSPIKIVLKKENNEWRVYSIEKNLTKKEQAKKSKILKIKRFYLNLARVNMHYLAQATHDNNMTILYNKISKKWQKETSSKKLEEIYGIFKKKNINLLALDKVEPILTKVYIGKNKILTIKGYYRIANSQKRLYFEEKFINENKHWALIALGTLIK